MKRTHKGSRDTLRRLLNPMIEALLRAAEGEWRGIILIGLGTGRRLNDIAQLRRDAIDLRHGLIRFDLAEPALGAEQVRLSPALRRFITMLPKPLTPDALLFPRSAKQTVGLLQQEFRQTATRAGLTRWTFDAVRLCCGLGLPQLDPGGGGVIDHRPPALRSRNAALSDAVMAGHSSIVTMWLVLEDLLVPVDQLGSRFLILDQPFEHPPADGEMILRIDSIQHQWRLRLPDGISPNSNRVNILRVSNG